jgi:hypothetical protein
MPMVQLPGLNTPQFDHCRSKLPRRPMPVPPIYEPELAAEAVHHAAHDRSRRQLWLGVSTAYTILGERLLPWLGDRYLGRTGVQAQLTSVPVELPRPGNLFEPEPGDPGAHGDFDAKAHSRSPLLTLSKHRRLLAAAAVATAATAAAARLPRLRAG